MNKLNNYVFSIFIILIFTPLYSNAEVVVIVHPSNTATIDAKAISKIYLGKSNSFPSGGEAVPINIKSGSSIVDEFNEKVVGKNSSQLKSYWSKLVFTGKGTPPKEVASEADVINLVKDNPAIIGYVSSGTATDGVKVVGSY